MLPFCFQRQTWYKKSYTDFKYLLNLKTFVAMQPHGRF